MTYILNVLAMGGYAAYVWSAYVLVLGVLLANGLFIKRQNVKIRRALVVFFRSPSL